MLPFLSKTHAFYEPDEPCNEEDDRGDGVEFVAAMPLGDTDIVFLFPCGRRKGDTITFFISLQGKGEGDNVVLLW